MFSFLHSSPAIASSKPLRAMPTALVAALSFLLGACGGGGGDGGAPSVTTPPSTGTLAKTMATAVSEASGTNCPYGGAKVSAGMDANTNGVLDPSEVSSVQYVCNGAPGADARASLVRVVAEPAGANCATGGSKVLVGVDTNSDGALGDAEVTATSYVCNGANGTNGTNGSNGANGTNGTNGTNGANGLSSLIAITAEPAGANCQYGGSKITAGPDTNNNSILDAGEVTATNYTCNPPPAGLSWLDAPVSTTAVPNRGYFASGASRVVITLPAAATPGDVISVSGTGAGGWTIAQGAGQQVMVRGVPLKLQAKFGVKDWTGLASSSDGSKLVAVARNDRIYVSTDFGDTWTPRGTTQTWTAVASSSDGSVMLAADDWNSWIWRSTDSGLTWAATSGAPQSRRSFAMTGDATVAYADGIWRSITGGATWYDSFVPPTGGYQAVACSADGMKVVVATGGGGTQAVNVYVSSNGGLTWSPKFSAPTTKTPHISVSADGSRMLLVSGMSYVSSDGGNTWNYAATSAERGAVSGDGKTMAMVGSSTGGPGGLSVSTDGGVSWAAVRTSPLWADSIALSTDGNRAVFAGYGGAIVATRLLQTTSGTGGQIDGEQFDTIELQYIGGGTYIVRNHSSASGFTVR